MKILLTIEIPDATLEETLKAEGSSKEQFLAELKEAFLPDAGELLPGATAFISISE